MSDETLDKDFGKYGQKFQLTLLSLFIQDKPFANKIIDILKPEYFDNKYLQWITKQAISYIQTYKTQPIFEDLKALIETQSGKSSKLYVASLDSIKSVSLENKDFVQIEAEKFCFIRHALNNLEQERNNVLLGQFDIAKQFAYQRYKPLAVEGQEIDLKRDSKEIMSRITHRNPVPLLLPSLNRVTKGGPGAGDLIIVCGSSSLGKTTLLTAQARHSAQQGKNVVYFSLETKGEQILERTIAGLIGIQQEFIREHPDLIDLKIKELPANIKFVRFKATLARVELIKNKIDEFKSNGFFPEEIIIDGLNQVKTPIHLKFQNSNDKFEYLAEEIRDMGNDLQLPIFAAFQSNRGGFNSEAPDEQNIGKAIEVYQVADLFFMLSQTPEMLELGECYITILKNRLGPKGMMLRLKYDPNLGTFDELETVIIFLLR